jgi:hypothetical protein
MPPFRLSRMAAIIGPSKRAAGTLTNSRRPANTMEATTRRDHSVADGSADSGPATTGVGLFKSRDLDQPGCGASWSHRVAGD